MATQRRKTVPDAVILLRTKLNRPPLTGDFVPRPRLLARLDAGLRRKLTLVCAPAGFGKSTLVTSWLERIAAAPGVASAWVSLDAGDNSLRQFLSYIVAAAQTVFPTALTRTAALLGAPVLPPAGYLVNTALAEMGGLADDFVLVLDDYHCLHDSEIRALVEAMLAQMPPRLHLVLIARQDPELPLGRLRVRGDLVEIRAADLRFQTEETAAFLENALGYALPADALAQLDGHTEGWIAALRLAAIAM